MATNTKRGIYQATITRGSGEDKERTTYHLQYNHNALRAIESFMGPMGHFDQRINQGHQGVDDLVVIIWGALQRHHDGEFATVDQVGELLDELMDDGSASAHTAYHALMDHSMDAYRDAVEAFDRFSQAPASQNSGNGSPKKGSKPTPIKSKSSGSRKASTSGTSTSAPPAEED